MTRTRSAIVGGLIGISLGGCGAGVHRRPAATAATRPLPAVTTVSAPRTPGPSPQLVALQRVMRSSLRAAGPATGAVVFDITAGLNLFAVRGGVARPPASVEKLFTTAAVLDELGPGAQLQTSVLGRGHLGPGGVWHGDLYLRGGGDPTFGDGSFNRVWEEGYGPTAEQLTAQLHGAGVRRVTGRVIADASLFDSRPGVPSSGFAPDIPDLGGQLAALTYDHGSAIGGLGPASFAARELVRTMHSAGISARAARHSGMTPLGSQLLASVSSPPMSVLLRLTDVPSDDFFAEMLTKQLGARVGGAGTTDAGAAVIAQVASRLGVTPAIVDGSGLSRQDQASPLQVVELLRALWGTATGRELIAALPVVGVNGTVGRLAGRTPAQGRCEAKTGTLDYVTNLAGYCHSRGGQLLAFAVFLDGPTNLKGSLLLGRMVAAIARY